MNLTASPTLAAQALSHIIDPFKPVQVSFTELGFSNFQATIKKYQTEIDENAERRYAIENTAFYGDIYLPLANKHKKR